MKTSEIKENKELKTMNSGKEVDRKESADIPSIVKEVSPSSEKFRFVKKEVLKELDIDDTCLKLRGRNRPTWLKAIDLTLEKTKQGTIKKLKNFFEDWDNEVCCCEKGNSLECEFCKEWRRETIKLIKQISDLK